MKLLMKFTFFLLVFLGMQSVSAQEMKFIHSTFYGFIENKGQWNQEVLFKSRFPGGNLWIQQHKLMFHIQDYHNLEYAHIHPNIPNEDTKFRQHIVNVNFVNSNEIKTIEKGTPSTEYYNYFIGNNPKKWKSDVHSYTEATLKNLYANIDLKLIEQKEQLKYEFHLAPNANPNLIALNITGQKNLSVNEDGELVIETVLGEILEEKPFSYQIINGKIKKIATSFKINGSTVQFELGNYDKSLPLVIDPILIFATYSGSVTNNFGMTATYAHSGAAYSGGTVFGDSYPTPDPNAYDTASNFTVTNVANSVCTDIFISKYSPDGHQMLWTTFFGGGDDTHGTETVHSLICDNNDDVYLYGATSSRDIPIVNGFQSVHGGGTTINILYNGVNFDDGTDIYVAKFSADGHQLLGSTYIGGSQNDGINYTLSGAAVNYGNPNAYDSVTVNYGDQFRGEIMLDQNNDILVATSTRSADFPTENPIQSTKGGGQDGVILKISNDLSQLLFSSYLGGNQNDACYSIKVDSSYNVVVSGATSSTDLPTTAGAYQTTYQGGKSDGFVLKMPSAMNAISYMSYIGTPNLDHAFFTEIDRHDNVYLYGVSQGGQFPVINAGYSNPGSGMFIAELNPTLSAIERSTVFGNGTGGINISPTAFLVDYCGNIYISGWGANLLQSVPLSGMPTTSDAFRQNPPDGFDFYLAVFDRDLNNLLYGTYIGDSNSHEHVDGGTSRFDKNGIIYQSVCGGCQGQSGFPTTPGAWSNYNLSTGCNNIVFKFDFEITPKASFTTDVTSGCAPLTIKFQNYSSYDGDYVWIFGDGVRDSTTFNPTKTYTTPGYYTVLLLVTDTICNITDTAKIDIHVFDSLQANVTPTIFTLCQSDTIVATATSSGTATNWQWSSNNQFSDNLGNDSVLTVVPTQDGFYYVKVSNQYCTIVDSVQVQFLGTGVDLTGTNQICKGDTSNIYATTDNNLFHLTYQWSPNAAIVSQPSDNHIVVAPDTSQFIYLKATTDDGCVYHDSIWVEVSSPPSIQVTATASDTIVFNGKTITLSATPIGNYDYTWTPTDGVKLPHSATTQAVVNGQTSYVVGVGNNGCYEYDTVVVYGKEFVCDEPYVYIPNAFSPNGDGDNDVLYVRSAVTHKVELRIFDRWGEMVFETTNQHKGWDGTYKGRPCDPDVYDYYLKATCIDNQQKIIKGNITLIR